MMPSALAVFGLMAGPMRSGLMSLLGQTRMSDYTIAMSAFPPLATRQRTSPKVRFVPTCDIERAGRPKEKSRPQAALNSDYRGSGGDQCWL